MSDRASLRRANRVAQISGVQKLHALIILAEALDAERKATTAEDSANYALHSTLEYWRASVNGPSANPMHLAQVATVVGQAQATLLHTKKERLAKRESRACAQSELNVRRARESALARIIKRNLRRLLRKREEMADAERHSRQSTRP